MKHAIDNFTYDEEYDYDGFYDDIDNDLFDNDEDDDEEYDSLISNKPYPKRPSDGDTMEIERELALC